MPEGEPTEQSKKEILPENSKQIYTFFIKNPSGEEINLPLYEYQEIDEKKKFNYFRYVVGWQKSLLPNNLKSLVESTPYWGVKNTYEDERYYYYQAGYRREDKKIPMDEIKKRVNFYFQAGKDAISYLKKYS